ncbi:MAG: hypothetical protein JXB07_21875 [Anaerolineae bacterium]|nr:hypothetical protein [Anaerolineae bacterium]
MRQRVLFTLLGGCLAVMLLGCSHKPAEILPTTTPAPTQIIPTNTATLLPPPTVTPFPTATPRGEEPLQDDNADVAGGASDNPDEPSVPSATDVPPTSAAPSDIPEGVGVAELVFSADFYQGWPSTSDGTAKIGIAGGQYLFEIGPFDARLVTTTAVNRRDMYIQAEVTPQKCPVKAGYGLIFRYADTGNYYLFTIFCDKTFAAGGRDGGSVFGTNNPLPDGLDPADPSVHYIGVLAQGDDFTIYLDRQPIGNFHDNRRQQGDVGIYAISQSDKAIQVAFDNLKVWALR